MLYKANPASYFALQLSALSRREGKIESGPGLLFWSINYFSLTLFNDAQTLIFANEGLNFKTFNASLVLY